MKYLYLLLLCAVSADAQFLGRYYVDTTMIPVGKKDATVRIAYLTPDLVVRWNGQDRVLEKEGSDSAFLKLLPEDTANSNLVEMTIVHPAAGRTLATAWIPVGFNVLVGDVMYDRPRGRAYITTPQQPGDTRFAAESLVAMNPETGEILQTVNLGGSPTRIALSNDGTTLYVALEGGGVVKRLDAETLTVASEFRFRTATPGPLGGFSKVGLAIQPGTQSTIGVYYAPNIGSSLHKLSIFDSGVKRANDLDVQDGFDSVIFSPEGKYMFLGSFAHANSRRSVVRYSVDTTGFTDRKAESAAGGGLVEFVGDLLFTSLGTAFNYKTMVLERSIGVSGSVAVDTERSRILAAYFLTSQNSSEYPQYLQAFDLESTTPLGWLNFSGVNYFGAGRSPTQRLIRFGTDGLIFTDSRGLVIFHTPLAGPAPVLTVEGVRNSGGEAVTSLRPGETLTLSGENLGPESALDTAEIEQTTSLGGVQVWFDSVPGVLTSVSRNEIKVKVPAKGLTPGSTVRLQVWYYGIPSRRLPFAVAQ